ncbi:PP2C family serine/threonine-protein phosphatase [Streptomyces roseolus]|uniref:PP2C family serine/threonine-protein phosphatase n=1 Tax=Streptomyces roseolus TaxID=67358 RepID=UPI001E5F4BCE|nr:PP2C family serine/threonine-protein phosphatase [Streptomyces roseolus]
MSALATWDILETSVIGYGKGLNQDSVRTGGTGAATDPVVLAVADGHGSASYPRSDIGARFAAELFAAKGREFGALVRTGRLPWLRDYARYELPEQLVRDWQARVWAHWGRQPGPEGADAPREEVLRLYGSTLVGAVLAPGLFVAWQLGDGDLTVVDPDGRVRLPLAPERAELGDETASLCLPEAWHLVRVHWEPLPEPARAPRLVALSTDGLSKSFASDAGFTEFTSGLYARLASRGLPGIEDDVPRWLEAASRHSGDDTTLALALRAEDGGAGRDGGVAGADPREAWARAPEPARPWGPGAETEAEADPTSDLSDPPSSLSNPGPNLSDPLSERSDPTGGTRNDDEETERP